MILTNVHAGEDSNNNRVIANGHIFGIHRLSHDETTFHLTCGHTGTDIVPEFTYRGEFPIPQSEYRPHVKVEGYVHTYEVEDRDGNRYQRQTFIATDVSKQGTLCDDVFGNKGCFYAAPQIAIFIKGTLEYIDGDIQNDKFVNLFVRPENEEHGIKISCRVYSTLKRIDPQIGEEVMCVCDLKTRKKNDSGLQYDNKITSYYENIILLDLATNEN